MFYSFISYFTDWAHTTTGQVHLIIAMLALTSGPILFISNKGTVLHKIVGYIFILALFATNITALFSYNLTGGFNFFHIAAFFSLGTLLPAIYFIQKAIRTKIEKYYIVHGILMSWAYFGLIAAFVAEVVTREIPTMLHGEGGWMRFLIALSIFMLITGWWVYKKSSTAVPNIIKRWIN